MPSNQSEILVSDDVVLSDEELKELLAQADVDSNALDPHSAPTVILIPPQMQA